MINYHRVFDGEEIEPVTADTYTLTSSVACSLKEYESDAEYFWVETFYKDDHYIDPERAKEISSWLMESGDAPENVTLEEINTVLDMLFLKLHDLRLRYTK